MEIHKRLSVAFVALALVQRGATAEPADNQPNRITNSIGMELILVNPGELTVPDRRAGGPRTLTVRKPFCLARLEVTQEQWHRVMGSNPSAFRGDERPVEMVTWLGCVEFCKKLSELEGRCYRLPTAVEWEYACRAGSEAVFCFGDDSEKLADYAWYGENSGSGADGTGRAVNGTTHPVGSKEPNVWGSTICMETSTSGAQMSTNARPRQGSDSKR